MDVGTGRLALYQGKASAWLQPGRNPSVAKGFSP
jgi:hypothetical protein